MSKRRKLTSENTKSTLYSILGVQTDSTEAEIRKAYRIRALLTHPDKRPDDPKAAENFAVLKQAHDILTDHERRKYYDETGDYGDESEKFGPAYHYFRDLFPKVSLEDIDMFSKTYPGSLDEDEDLLNFYHRFKGDVTTILDWIPLSEPKDVNRLLESLTRLTEHYRLAHKTTFDRSAMTLRAFVSRKIARKLKESGSRSSNENSLLATISANQNRRKLDVIAHIESKYIKTSKKSTQVPK